MYTLYIHERYYVVIFLQTVKAMFFMHLMDFYINFPPNRANIKNITSTSLKAKIFHLQILSLYQKFIQIQ